MSLKWRYLVFSNVPPRPATGISYAAPYQHDTKSNCRQNLPSQHVYHLKPAPLSSPYLHSKSHSDARVILEESNIRLPMILRVAEPLVPRCATILHRLEPRRRELLLQVLLPLQDLHGQARRCVPCNVAVNEPSTWIVRFECNGNEAIRRKQNDITTRWVLGFEVDFVGVERR